MKWVWFNTTQLGYGVGIVRESLAQFIHPKWKILCTFGGGSIDKNGVRDDVEAVLSGLECDVLWEGGIVANPDFDRLMQIVQVAKRFEPDLLLAVGGGTVIDGTKFVSLAAMLEEGENAWGIVSEGEGPAASIPVGVVLTLPGSGSEWNSRFVISRRSLNAKVCGENVLAYPVFSLIDPMYMMSLPVRQLRNGVFSAISHCIDQFVTGQEVPLMDAYWLETMKELVKIGPDVVAEDSTPALRERLIIAATFSLNSAFTAGKETCWGIQTICHQLTVQYGIDHAAAAAIVAPAFLECHITTRKRLMAKAAEVVFCCTDESHDNLARSFINELRLFIARIQLPAKVSDWAGATVEQGDIDTLVAHVMASAGGKPFGWRDRVTENIVREVLTKCVV
jgi:alcohol dehydrogenase YqhD (iron-dependent ADH family)